MAATLADFRARSQFAGFANVPDAAVTIALADATLTCSERFGDKLDLAVMTYAAHLLTLGPFGQESDKGEDGTTRFLGEWTKLALHFRGPYTIGQDLG